MRPRFSLRTLFILIALLALPCAWVGRQYQIVQERKAMINTLSS